MTQDEDPKTATLVEVSNAIVRLHKEQFGRGPTQARSHFAGPDMLICALENVLLPAEIKMVALDQEASVRDTRLRFQVATSQDFVSAIETIVGRTVRSFTSSLDAQGNMAFEIFVFTRD